MKNSFVFFICFSFFVGLFCGFCFKKEKIKVVEVEKIKHEVVYLKDEQKEEVVEMLATAYCSCEKCCGVWATKRQKGENGKPIVYTASGTVAKQGRTVAVDTKFIPYGTKILFDGKVYIAEDCGGAIKGNRIDFYFDDHKEALKFGKKKIIVTIKKEK